jgi:predicted nucleotidyltransferase
MSKSTLVTQVQTKQDILVHLRQHQTHIKSLGGKKLGLFGSFVRDEQTAESDIDLLVEFDADQKTFDNFMQLSFLLEDILSHPVELVTLESLSPYLCLYILPAITTTD